MKSSLVTIRLSAFLACMTLLPALPFAAKAVAQDNWLVEQDFADPELAEPPTGAADCLLAVQEASDPATAEDAYQRGIAAGADPVAINQSYVREMINLGLPGQAEDAAEQIVDVFPQDGVAWAVLAYADGARNDTTAALAEMATAVDWAPEDPFVLGVAGKLMAWYRLLGDPSELPEGLPERLDEIHAQLSALEAYRTAFEAAVDYYQSQAGAPIPDYPEETVEPAFGGFTYNPGLCTTYNEYAYSGFTVPCFSVSWLVPRVACYISHDRPVYRHLRFHIGDRCGRYHDRFHARRLNWDRIRRRAAYYVAGRIRLTSRPESHLPRVHARYTRAMFSSRHVGALSTRTDPPPAAPRQAVRAVSARLERAHSGHTSAASPLAHRPDSEFHKTGSKPQSWITSSLPRSGAIRQEVHTRRSQPKLDSRIRIGTDSSAHARFEPQSQRRPSASRLPQRRDHSRDLRPDPKPEVVTKTTPEKGPQRGPGTGWQPTVRRTRPRANPKPASDAGRQPSAHSRRDSGGQQHAAPHGADLKPQTKVAPKSQPEPQPAGRSHQTGARRDSKPRVSARRTATGARSASVRPSSHRATRPSAAPVKTGQARSRSSRSASAGGSRRAPTGYRPQQSRKSGRGK